MKLSIIIPMYNVETYITKCLDSCIKQDLSSEEYEIICVNDGSPDNSAKIARTIAEKHSNIKVIDRKNGGLSAARNTGLKYAQGDYVWFIDSDDWIVENCLKKVLDICKSHNLDILQICAANIFGGKIVRKVSYKDDSQVVSGVEALRRGIFYCAQYSIIRRLFLLENGLSFHEGIVHEDNEYTPRVYYFAKRVLAISDILYFVYQNPHSITRTVNPKKAFDCITVMYELDNFMKDIKQDSKDVFHYHIASTFNVSMCDIIKTTPKDMDEFSKELYKNRHLYKHLIKQHKIIYKIEGILMMIFPHHPITIYKIMNMFDKRKLKTVKNTYA